MKMFYIQVTLLSTPTKWGRSTISDNDFEFKHANFRTLICGLNVKTGYEINRRGRGDGESPAKQRRYGDIGGDQYTILYEMLREQNQFLIKQFDHLYNIKPTLLSVHYRVWSSSIIKLENENILTKNNFLSKVCSGIYIFKSGKVQ